MEEAVVSNELPPEDKAPEDRAIGRPCGRGRVLHFVVVPEKKKEVASLIQASLILGTIMNYVL